MRGTNMLQYTAYRAFINISYDTRYRSNMASTTFESINLKRPRRDYLIAHYANLLYRLMFK